MEGSLGRDLARAGLLLIGAALAAALLATVRLLPPVHPATTGLAWVEAALLGALALVAAATALACLVGGLRQGSVASLAGAGAAAAVAGGSIGEVAGADAFVGALPIGAALLAGAAVAYRSGTLIGGRRARIATAGGSLLLAEAGALAAVVPPGAELLLPITPFLLTGAAALSLGGSLVAPRHAPIGLMAALASIALLVDRGGSLEHLVGVGALIAAQLAALRILADASASGPADGDAVHLPPLTGYLTEPVLAFDGRLQLVDWNATATSLLGLDAGSRGARLEDLLGVSITRLPGPDGTATRAPGIGGLEIALHRSDGGLIAVLHDAGTDEDADRLARELRGTLEELLRARRTIELQREELEQSAAVDRLTGVASRGAILDRLRVEIAQARRYQHPVAVVLLDVDDFVEINRRHGVAGGDALLREVALRMRLRVREADALGRSGSDGFLAILPHTDEEGAATFADALRRRLGQRPIPLGKELATATVSIGVAVMRPGESLDLDGLLARVTEALDSARRAGGDRIALDRLHGLARLEDRRPSNGPRDSKAQDSGR